MATRRGSKEDAQPGSLLLVVHDFVARSNDELSLAKGDRIELIEKDDDFGDGWFLGRHLTNAKTGLFPEGESAREAISKWKRETDCVQYTQLQRRRVITSMLNRNVQRATHYRELRKAATAQPLRCSKGILQQPRCHPGP